MTLSDSHPSPLHAKASLAGFSQPVRDACAFFALHSVRAPLSLTRSVRTRTALSIFVAPLPHRGRTFAPQRTKIEVAAPPLGIFSLPLQQRTEVVLRPHVLNE